MNTRYIKNTMWASALFIALTLVPSVWADTIAPGGSGAPDVISGGVGEAILATMDTASANITVLSDPSNPFCAGCLDFNFLVQNTSAETVTQIAGTSFAGFLTDVGVPGGFGGPGTFCEIGVVTFSGVSSVSRSADGSAVNFNFSGIPAGECSVPPIIQTNATSFTTGTLSLIGASGVIETIESFEPTASTSTPIPTPTPTSTPEPSSLLLLGSGLLGMVGLRWKQNV